MSDEQPDEQNPAELLKRIDALERRFEAIEARCIELEAGIVRMATYQGVLHVLRDTGPK